MKIPDSIPRPLLAGLCLIIIAVVMFVLFSDRTPRVVKEAGKVLFDDLSGQAVQLAAVLDPGARVVVMELTGSIKGHGKKRYDQVLDALEGAGVNVVALEPLVRDESRGWDEFMPGFPYGEFVRVAAAHPDTDAILSLCGTPYGTGNGEWPDANDLPKLLVAGKGQGTVDPGMVKLGWVDAATVPRAVMKGDTQVLEYDLIRPQ